MTAYIVRRLVQSVVTLFILSIMFFLLARQVAGNPCATLGCRSVG